MITFPAGKRKCISHFDRTIMQASYIAITLFGFGLGILTPQQFIAMYKVTSYILFFDKSKSTEYSHYNNISFWMVHCLLYV